MRNIYSYCDIFGVIKINEVVKIRQRDKEGGGEMMKERGSKRLCRQSESRCVTLRKTSVTAQIR